MLLVHAGFLLDCWCSIQRLNVWGNIFCARIIAVHRVWELLLRCVHVQVVGQSLGIKQPGAHSLPAMVSLLSTWVSASARALFLWIVALQMVCALYCCQ